MMDSLLSAIVSVLLFTHTEALFGPCFAPGLCRGQPWAYPCEKTEFSALPFCDTNLGIDDRVSDYISRISLDEKLGRNSTFTPFSYYSPQLSSVGVDSFQWWNEALHGIAKSPGVSFREIKAGTSFPQVITTSMSFNRSLYYNVASSISTEARAFGNSNQSGFTFWFELTVLWPRYRS
jgi:hypothetical protein